VEEYPIPFTTAINNKTIPGLNNKLVQDRTALSCAIRKGADGNIYFANGLRNQLGRINPQTKKIQIFQPPGTPVGNLQPFNDLYSAADGIYVTQTTDNIFNFFSFKTELFTTYKVPTPGALPLGLYVASDQKVYIAELLGNKILIFDPKTKAINEYPLPELAQFPAVIRAERYLRSRLSCEEQDFANFR
jgi:streptogramin lyase